VIPGALLVAALFAAAVAAPLATHTVTLALFGLPHVLAELRYVGARFAPRAAPSARAAVAGLLAAVFALRAAQAAGWIAASPVTELALAAALTAVALPALLRRGPGAAALGVAAVASVAAGAAVAPVETLLLFAVLHNLTPLGFLAEAAPRRLALAAAVFVALPLLIATGLPWRLWTAVLPAAPELDPLGAGALAGHLGAFFPAALHDRPWAMHAFAAVAFAQGMHHAAVLGVLPRLQPGAWPRSLVAGLALAGVGAAALFAGNFAGTRRLYGAVAAVHAWVELPVLLAALTPAAARARTTPRWRGTT
jgi:hypothetical protein